MSKLAGKAHRPTLDNLSPAQMRVVLEELLFTMETKQREDFMGTFPGLYKMIFPEVHHVPIADMFNKKHTDAVPFS